MSDFDREPQPGAERPRETERTTIIDTGGDGDRGDRKTMAIVVVILLLGIAAVLYYLLAYRTQAVDDTIGVNVTLPRVETPDINVNLPDLPDVNVDPSKIDLPDVDVKTEGETSNKAR
jgi:hypothetical protein